MICQVLPPPPPPGMHIKGVACLFPFFSGKGVFFVKAIIFLPYPDNSPPGQFPTIQALVLMSGFIPWYGPSGESPSGES